MHGAKSTPGLFVLRMLMISLKCHPILFQVMRYLGRTFHGRVLSNRARASVRTGSGRNARYVRLIEGRRPQEWAASSPDHTPCDVYIFSQMKHDPVHGVYKNWMPRNEEDLREKIKIAHENALNPEHIRKTFQQGNHS